MVVVVMMMSYLVGFGEKMQEDLFLLLLPHPTTTSREQLDDGLPPGSLLVGSANPGRPNTKLLLDFASSSSSFLSLQNFSEEELASSESIAGLPAGDRGDPPKRNQHGESGC